MKTAPKQTQPSSAQLISAQDCDGTNVETNFSVEDLTAKQPEIKRV
jgi:hypothetical protein